MRSRSAARCALVLGVALVAGCSIEPVREVAGPTPAVEPAELAFTDDTATPDSTTTGGAGDPAEVEQTEAAAHTVVTDAAVVGVHSGPDILYTRLGALGPGDNVLTTGRLVDVQGIAWMEVNWRGETAWMIAGALAPLRGQ